MSTSTQKKQDSHARVRRHATRRSVRILDRVATIGITVGGFATILAVAGVCIFLISVVVPLFLPGSARVPGGYAEDPADSTPVRFGVDEYRAMTWAFFPDGTVRLSRLDTGEVLEEQRLFEGADLTAWAFSRDGARVALGSRDGRVRTGSIGFVSDFPDTATLPESVRTLEVGRRSALAGSIVEMTPERQLRRERLRLTMNPPVVVDTTQSVVLVDIASGDSGPVLATLTSDGVLRYSRVRETENLMTGETVQSLEGVTLPSPVPGARDGSTMTHSPSQSTWPAQIVLLESGRNLAVIWSDGRLLRYDTQNPEAPRVAERVSIAGDDATGFARAQLLLGDATLLVGETSGDVRAWFAHKPEYAETPDGAVMVAAHRFEGTGAAVTALASSPRTRVMAVGYADGRIRLYQVTSGKKILEVVAEAGEPVVGVQIAPKNDGIVALTRKSVWHWDVDMGYPEATLRALFRPVWYESHEKPAHVWQSSGGTDDFEPKLGLWPLVFGTLKATLYSLLFGAPIALLAAVFSSEFLAPALRTRVKTLIEFMASLPSVVLGFLAALVFAPFVQSIVPTVLVSFVTIPATILIGAYAWQLLPQHTTLRLAPYRLFFVLALLPTGMLFAAGFGPFVERLFFLGNIKLWLDGNQGSGFGGWFLLVLPVSALAVAVAMTRYLGGWFRQKATTVDRPRLAALDFARFIAGAVLTLGIALAAAELLQLTGIDPRGEGRYFGTYVQRNALIVGFVMGFAIIPIVYTIAEDALSAVPEHLRAASLGAGATPWQTAFRIVIPTAMSGLFSALMIGLGRAVGETMIVLMAAGNTPILDINIFNGFRTLSANIAVELPEAARNSTHYRTLFLAALILFAMTFVINTAAEIVRLRFRKRAHQL